MNPVCERLVSHQMPTAPLWSFGYGDLREAFEKAIDMANLGCLSPTLYSLRHSGASHDVIMEFRTLVEVAKRGRWRSSQNVRRYEKHGRLSLQINRLSSTVLAQLMRDEERLPDLFVAGSDALVDAQSAQARERATARRTTTARSATTAGTTTSTTMTANSTARLAATAMAAATAKATARSPTDGKGNGDGDCGSNGNSKGHVNGNGNERRLRGVAAPAAAATTRTPAARAQTTARATAAAARRNSTRRVPGVVRVIHALAEFLALSVALAFSDSRAGWVPEKPRSRGWRLCASKIGSR